MTAVLEHPWYAMSKKVSSRSAVRRRYGIAQKCVDGLPPLQNLTELSFTRFVHWRLDNIDSRSSHSHLTWNSLQSVVLTIIMTMLYIPCLCIGSFLLVTVSSFALPSLPRYAILPRYVSSFVWTLSILVMTLSNTPKVLLYPSVMCFEILT